MIRTGPLSGLRTSSADGRVISAVSAGSGPAVLVVHPGGSDAGSWAAVAALLVDRFRVVRLRRRIHVAGRRSSCRSAGHAKPRASSVAEVDLLLHLQHRLEPS